MAACQGLSAVGQAGQNLMANCCHCAQFSGDPAFNLRVGFQHARQSGFVPLPVEDLLCAYPARFLFASPRHLPACWGPACLAVCSV
ncbi:hypothetical protein PSEUDO8Z_160302 [Pseudomonas sp. 8Z]|nr:hypothetical protein PSEUDO8Z_160302 [Pseudomonas sp. 8Z]